MEKTYIAVIGKTCAGKGTFVRFLQEELVGKVKFSSHRFSDPLNKALDVLHYPDFDKRVLDILYLPYTEDSINKVTGTLSSFHVINEVALHKSIDIRFSKSRPNQQYLSTRLRQAFGEEVLGHALQRRAEADESDVVFFDGVRRPQDIVMLRRLPRSIVVHISASPKARFERLKKRADRPGDAEKTWPEFQAEQSAESESMIDIIAKEADVHIENPDEEDVTFPNFRFEIKKLLRERTNLV